MIIPFICDQVAIHADADAIIRFAGKGGVASKQKVSCPPDRVVVSADALNAGTAGSPSVVYRSVYTAARDRRSCKGKVVEVLGVELPSRTSSCRYGWSCRSEDSSRNIINVLNVGSIF